MAVRGHWAEAAYLHLGDTAQLQSDNVSLKVAP